MEILISVTTIFIIYWAYSTLFVYWSVLFGAKYTERDIFQKLKGILGLTRHGCLAAYLIKMIIHNYKEGFDLVRSILLVVVGLVWWFLTKDWDKDYRKKLKERLLSKVKVLGSKLKIVPNTV